MNSIQIAQMIDISAVRSHHSMDAILEMVSYAKKYHFINVHVLPSWVKILADLLTGVEGTYVGSPVGFPSGASKTEIKVLEASQLIEDGVQEMDIVMNIGRLKNHEYDYVKNELAELIRLADHKVITKLIVEMNCLSDQELLKACEISIECGFDFIKTGTGWVPGNLDLDRIRLIKKAAGNQIKVKVAGGIRTKENVVQLLDLGVERFGINYQTAIEIVNCF